MSFFIIVILNLQPVYSQDVKCNCEQALLQLISKVETEYPGFADKTKDKSLYNNLKESLQMESKKTDDSACLKLLQKYIGFQKDPHLIVSPNGGDTSSNSASANETVNIDLQDFQQKVQRTTDQLEGVWSNQNYKIGLKRTSENEYVGFIIETANNSWKPGEIKFRLLANGNSEYAMIDHSIQKETYSVFDDSILLINGVNAVFTKQSPKPKLDAKLLQKKLDEVEGFYFKKLTPKTSILKISSFNYPDLERVRKLYNKNKSSLENSENLIIDIRDNPGGTDAAYQELLPYIVTNPIRNLAAEFLATQTYINNLEKYLKSIKDPAKQKDEIARIRKRIEVLEANLGKFVGSSYFDKNAEPVPISKIKPARKSPKQIVILSNKGVGSAAENFVYKVKQSKKVKILGTPTYGGLDYGNAYWISFGCQNYQVLMPTYRASRLPDYPIDNIGFQPDVYLDDSVKDWVKFAVEYLEG